MPLLSHHLAYFECVVSLIYFHFFLLQIYLKNTALYTVEANNPRQLVELAARDIEKLLSNRSKALVVSTEGLSFLFSILRDLYLLLKHASIVIFTACTLRGSVSCDVYKT